MKQQTVFTFDSYKPLMSHMLLGPTRRGQLSRAAEFMKCQRSYLSRIMKDKQHLTLDQAYLLARFWKLRDDEREYFSTLVELDRAGQPEYRQYLKSRVSEMKRKYESIQERTQRQSHVTDNLELQYFSTWISCALQFLTMVPEFQNINSLAERLSLNKKIVAEYLTQLEKVGLVETKHGKWMNKSSNFHIPKESVLVQLHHQNWRARAMLDAQNPSTDHVHFTGVYSLSVSDLNRIKEMLLSFVADANEIVGPSECEETIALTCDLFRV